MDTFSPQLTAALNEIAKRQPEEPLQELAKLISAAGSGAVDVTDAAPAPPPKKDDEPTADTHVELGGLTPANAPAVEAAIKGTPGVISCVVDVEGKVAKVVGAPGYPTGAQLVEAVQKGVKGVSAKEKQLSGGKHKFDPSEVDVHGGNATADDFMDAFGF